MAKPAAIMFPRRSRLPPSVSATAVRIVGLARATGMTMEELAQYLMHIKKGGSPFCSTQKEDMENAPEEN